MTNATLKIVSIILPVFNAEKYIGKAIQSILNQTFKDFELIIINDGSTDNSLKIIQTFKDKRIQLINNQSNQGISYSLNKGIEIVKGKYIARMDADDIAFPNRLEKQFDYLEKNPAVDLIGSSIQLINQFGKILSFDIRNYNHEMIECLLIFTCPFYHPTIMGKTRVFKNLQYDSKFDGMEDWELWTRIIKTCKVASIPEVLLQYRIHKNNISKTINTKKSTLRLLIKRQLQWYMNINDNQAINTHIATCTDAILEPVTEKELKINNNWLLDLCLQNKRNYYFDDKIFETAIRQTWFSFINRTIKNRQYSTLHLIITNRIKLSNKQRLYIFLKGAYFSKLNFIDSIFKIIKIQDND